MIYHHRFRVNAPLATVAKFHKESASMSAITPPPIVIRVHKAPPLLARGDQMDFTMWLGPLPVRWIALIEGVEATGFVDRQLQGPFRNWVHKHIFIAIDDRTTEVYDEVMVELHDTNRFWQLVGLTMWFGLPLLFAYRGWKTRRLLDKSVH